MSTHCSGSAAKTYFDLFLILIDYCLLCILSLIFLMFHIPVKTSPPTIKFLIYFFISHRPDLKLILMSATLNSEMFSAYFGEKLSRVNSVLIIVIEERVKWRKGLLRQIFGTSSVTLPMGCSYKMSYEPLTLPEGKWKNGWYIWNLWRHSYSKMAVNQNTHSYLSSEGEKIDWKQP